MRYTLEEAEEVVAKAFATTSRRGGTSWGESIMIAEKNWSDEPTTDLVWKDTDIEWSDLLSSDWNPFPPDGGIYFTNSLSFAYYLAALLTYGLRNPPCESLGYELISCREKIRTNLTKDQKAAVHLVIDTMLNWCRIHEKRMALKGWNRVLESIKSL